MRKLLTNCPNCGGVLSTDGRCPYCGTHARYANEIDIQTDNFHLNKIELSINVKCGDTTIVYPLVGYVESVTIDRNMYSVPEVEMTFRGHMIDI